MERFLSHLYALIAGKADLTATDEIKDAKGHSIVKKGGTITPEVYQNIRNRCEPDILFQSVVFSAMITPDDLYNQIGAQIEKDTSFQSIDQLSDWDSLKKCCATTLELPYLNEILTAFSIEAPLLFSQSLLSAYLAFIVQVTTKAEQTAIFQGFLTGLIHDVGILFISRKVRNKTGRLNGNEWRQLQLHPIIGHKMLKKIPNFPDEVNKAVLAHHERLDGSGYPLGKREGEINDLALIISLLDDIVAIYRKKFKPLNRSLNDMYPIIQMNSDGYPDTILSKMLQILKVVKPSESSDIDINTLKDLIEYTYQQQLFINKLLDIAEQVDRTIDPEEVTDEVSLLQNDHKKLSNLVTSSGLKESYYIEWLQKLSSDEWPTMYNEIEHTRLMLEEVIYRLNSFYNAVSAFTSRNNSETAKNYQLFVHVYSVTAYPSIPSSLENYWHREEK